MRIKGRVGVYIYIYRKRETERKRTRKENIDYSMTKRLMIRLGLALLPDPFQLSFSDYVSFKFSTLSM